MVGKARVVVVVDHFLVGWLILNMMTLLFNFQRAGFRFRIQKGVIIIIIFCFSSRPCEFGPSNFRSLQIRGGPFDQGSPSSIFFLATFCTFKSSNIPACCVDSFQLAIIILLLRLFIGWGGYYGFVTTLILCTIT